MNRKNTLVLTVSVVLEDAEETPMKQLCCYRETFGGETSLVGPTRIDADDPVQQQQLLDGAYEAFIMACSRAHGDPPEGGITIAYFGDEELHVMRQCLEAFVSNRHIRVDEVGDDIWLLTGRRVAEFEALLERFDTLEEFSREEFAIIAQAVGQLAYYPIAYPDELEARLGFPLQHLNWLSSMLTAIKQDWERYVEGNADVRSRAAMNRTEH